MAPKVLRTARDSGTHEELPQPSTRPFSRQSLAAKFNFKVRIHSRKKAQSHDPKPTTPPLEATRLDGPVEAECASDENSHEDGWGDEFPIASDDPTFQPLPGNDELVPLDVGYLRDELAPRHEFAEMLWLEVIDVVAMCAQPFGDEYGDRNRVGFCGAKLIRNKVGSRRSFYSRMAMLFDESTLMCFDLFDHDGRLKHYYRYHKFLKGSGAWQEQLNDSDILLIEDIIVDERYQRQGLGTAMVETLFEATRRKTKGGNFAAILWPQCFKDDHFQDLLQTYVSPSGSLSRAEIIDHCDSAAIPWARSIGFRRIGLSMWFGLLCRGGKTSPAIPVEDDPDPHMPKRVRHLLPDALQNAQSDEQFLATARQHYRQVGAEDKSWLATDGERNTLLHLACLRFFPKSLAWIMQQSCSDRLLKMRNSSRFEPLEALLEKLEIMRTRTVVGTSIILSPDGFEGHTLDQARCVALLQRIEIDSEEELDLFRYGCTCGECGGGFISPRMNHALFMKAFLEHDRLGEDLALSGERFFEDNKWDLMQLPDYSIKYVKHYKAIREGLVKVCDHISDVLLDRLEPSHHLLKFYMSLSQDKQPDLVKKFFRSKAIIEGVVGMIMEKASWDDEIHGDGWIREMRDDDSDFEEAECRNDHEFALVARMCGYDEIAEWLGMNGSISLPLS